MYRVDVRREAGNKLVEQVRPNGLRQVENGRLCGTGPLGFHGAKVRVGPQGGDEILLVGILRVPEEGANVVGNVVIDTEHVLAEVGGQARRRRIAQDAVVRQRNQAVEQRLRRGIDGNQIVGEGRVGVRVYGRRATGGGDDVVVGRSRIAFTEVSLPHPGGGNFLI